MPVEADVVAAIKALQSALGDNDLAKQVFADASAIGSPNHPQSL
jgi:hypothetical protein